MYQSLYTLINFLFQELGWDLSQFPNIERWYKECSILPGYEENLEGARAFAGLVKRNLK